jgi:hypothetical protein
MGPLAHKVVRLIELKGIEAASKIFEVSPSLVRQWRIGSRTPSLRAVEVAMEIEGVMESIPAPEKPAEETTPAPELPDTGYEIDLGATKVALLLPWYRSANPFTAMSVMGLFDRATTRCFMAHGDAFISHTRNRLASLFLESGCEWGLMIDDDMILPWGKAAWFKEATGFSRIPDANAGLHTLARLISHRKTLVGGLYVGKNPKDLRPMFAEGCSSSNGQKAVNDGTWKNQCLATKWVATGCLLIHRKVFEDISAKYPHLKGGWFSPSEHDLVAGVERAVQTLQGPETPNGKAYDALTILADCKARADAVSKLGTGEDVIFSHRAAACGHIPHVDTGLILGHVGNFTYGPKWVL